MGLCQRGRGGVWQKEGRLKIPVLTAAFDLRQQSLREESEEACLLGMGPGRRQRAMFLD